MKYSEYIEVNEGFQTSINLEYDLNKIEKVKGFIPTEQSVKILGKLLQSFYYHNNTSERATVLIGPYGRGKSHLLLVLTALTSMDLFMQDQYSKEEARKIQLELCDKIKSVDSEVGALARAIVEDGIRTLPIIINSNSTDINQSFLIALKTALEIADLDSLLPDTYFDAALAVLDKWREYYPEAWAQLKAVLQVKKESIENLYIGLKQYNHEAYIDFCECYPKVAAGTEFNPLTNMDVVKLYMAVNEALTEQTEYCGIHIIFDEFSKFLEANLDKSKMLNFKIIQDMAEATTRSGRKQMHFTCITHKNILDYSSSDSFKTVEGRFHNIQYVASCEQSYELIANAIPKNKKFAELKEAYVDVFTRLTDSAAVVGVFNDLTEDVFQNKVVLGCFPLAPLSTFALLRISELVGQNERTLFTFLAKKDKFSLPDFMARERTQLDIVTIDSIYDYFQDLLKKEVFNTSIHSIWSKTDTALTQVKDSVQQKILKAIAIINMIQDERLKPVATQIKAALMMDDDVFEKAINGLKKNHIVSKRDNAEFVLLTANGVDVQKNIENYVNSKISRIKVCELLNEYFPLGYVMPREYNDRYSMLRYFKKIYMDEKMLFSYKNGQSLLDDYPYDGVLVYLIQSEGISLEEVKLHLDLFKDAPQIVICVSDYHAEIESLLKRMVAVKNLYLSDLVADPHYLEEIEIYEEDLRKQTISIIDKMYAPNSRHSKYLNCERLFDIYRQADLNQAVTQICLQCYYATPAINNEMVNKSVLNSQNLKGRNITVDWILSHSDDTEIPCMEGYGPEVSIFKSMYSYTGLDKSETVRDEGINLVLQIIDEFIRSSESKAVCLEKLYLQLQTPPYGMRKGIIPLFLAYVLRKYKENIIFYFKGKEVELSAAILSALNDSPKDYSILLEKGTEEREVFLNQLEELFAEYKDNNYSSINRVYTVVRTMQNWMRSLPEYTKKFTWYYNASEKKQISDTARLIRNDLLKFEVNSRELLFKKWIPKLSQNDEQTCIQQISEIHNLFKYHVTEYRKELCNRIAKRLVQDYSGSLCSAIQIWFSKLPNATKMHVFDSSTNELLALAEKWNSYDEQLLLDELAILFVSMGVEDWSDKLAVQFEESIYEVIQKINDFVEVPVDEQECRLAINLPNIQIDKSFSDSEISPLGKTVLNNLRAVFEEYNGAIEVDEQLAIIAELIGDIVQ